MAANDIIDYNGFQIASGALDDPTLELLRQKGLLPQDGGMSVDNTPPAADQIQSPPVYDLLGSSRSGMMSDFRPQVANSLNQMNPEDQFVSPLLRGNSDLAKTVELPYAPDQSIESQAQSQAAAQSPISKTPMSPAKQALSPYEQIIKGTSGRLKTEANLAQSQADTYQQIASQRESMNQRLESRWAELDQARSELDNKREQAQKEFDQTKTESYWDRKGPGEKVLAALAVGLGTFASSWKGVPNIAFQMLQDDIKQDYQLQRDAVERAKGKVDRVDNDYARLLSVYKNEDLAQKAFFENRTQGLIEKLEGIKAQGVADNVKNTIDEQVGRLRLEQQKYNADLLKQFADMKANEQKSQSESPAQQAIDKKFGETYQEYFVDGKIGDMDKNIEQLEFALDNLKNYNVTGPGISRTPDFLKQIFNQRAVATKDAIEQVVQQDLRRTLGAQFTENEGKRLIERAFNDRLSEEENIRRVSALINAMKQARDTMTKSAEYYENNGGSLAGFPGVALSRIRTANDFENAFMNGSGQSQGQSKDEMDYQYYSNKLKENPNDPKLKQVVQILGQKLGK